MNNNLFYDDGTPKGITLGDYRKAHSKSESPLDKATATKSVVVPPDYDVCFEALNQAQPQTQPHLRLKAHFQKCDRCGNGGTTYIDPYSFSGKFICEECDEVLAGIIERIPNNDKFYITIVRLIVDAFFCKVEES